MVSLLRNLNTSGSGAVFFDSSLNMDENEYLQPVLSSQETNNFLKLNTIINIWTTFLFGVTVEVIGLVLAFSPNEAQKCSGYFLFLFMRVTYWTLHIGSQRMLQAQHRQLRIRGYMDFYQLTYRHIRSPLLVVSLWNSVYLFLAAIIQQYHKEDFDTYCKNSAWLTPLNYVILLHAVELIILLAVYIDYTKKVSRFNRTKPPPDVMREEWLSSFAQDSYAGSGEVGYQQRGSSLEEILEKQADLIRYLKDHNAKLSERVMLLANNQPGTEQPTGDA